jgi:transglutaminase-like putative cysteine protease
MTKQHVLAFALALAACKGREQAPAAKPATPPAPPTATAAPVDAAKLVEIAQSDRDRKDYPDADSVVAIDRDDIVLGPDGTVVEHHHMIVKILHAQRGKDKFADIKIPFDTRRQTLEIVSARTVTNDGKTHVASGEEISDIVPQRLSEATMYSDVRERVVSFPAVDSGSVVELAYKRTTRAGPDAPLGGELMIGAWHPIRLREITFTVPAGTTPKFALTNLTLAPVEAAGEGGTRTYTFTVKDQPDRSQESGAIADAGVLPRLVYGLRPGWKQATAAIGERFLRTAMPDKTHEAITAQAAQLTASAITDEDKARAIFKFVAHDVRSIDLPLGWAGYEPHAPDVVLANRYGDDRDKVALLVALCAAAKLDARPVLVRTGKVPVLDGVPTVAQFDRMIAKVVIGGKDLWLDPSDEHGQFGIAFAGQDNLVLPLGRGGGELGKRPLLEPSTSIAHTTATFSLAGNGDLDATYRHAFTGWYADRASQTLRPLKGEHLTRFFQQEAATIAASAIASGHDVGDTLSVSGPLEVDQRVKIPGYAEAQGTFRVFELPFSPLDLVDDIPQAGLETRKYPMWIGTPRTRKHDVTLEVPAGWKIAYAPPELKGAAEGIAFASTCKDEGRRVTCASEVTVDRFDVAPDKYAGYRDALAKLRAYERRIVLLIKG